MHARKAREQRACSDRWTHVRKGEANKHGRGGEPMITKWETHRWSAPFVNFLLPFWRRQNTFNLSTNRHFSSFLFCMSWILVCFPLRSHSLHYLQHTFLGKPLYHVDFLEAVIFQGGWDHKLRAKLQLKNIFSRSKKKRSSNVIWTTGNTKSCFCWLNKILPFFLVEYILNFILVSSICWCGVSTQL